MKYAIVTLIRGEAGKYQQDLLYSVAEKFDVKEAVKREPPAHIALKSPFFYDYVKPLEACIDDFCKTHKKCDYELNGFGNFGNAAIFIEVFPSVEMKKLCAEFVDSLKKVPDLPWKKHDDDTHLHASIAYTDIGDRFSYIQSYLSGKKPYFNVVMDNISILSLCGGVWKVHKEYLLKDQ